MTDVYPPNSLNSEDDRSRQDPRTGPGCQTWTKDPVKESGKYQFTGLSRVRKTHGSSFPDLQEGRQGVWETGQILRY